MSDFIRDGTALWDDKSNFGGRTPNTPTQQWAASDVALVKAALLSIQTYLRTGTFDVPAVTTIPTASATTANILNANVTALVAGDVNVTANTSASIGPETDYVGFRGQWFHGVDVANTPTSRDYVLTGLRTSYSISDGVINSGSQTLTSAADGNFVTAQVGAAVSGTGIPAGTTITAVGGLTSLTMSNSATVNATGARITITTGGSQDLMYWKHRGGLSPTVGIGVTPPDGTARLQVSPQDTEPAMGTIRLRVGPSQTGKALTVHDSGAVDRWWVTSDFYVSGNHPIGGAMVVQADVTNARAVVMADNAKSNFYGFTFPGGNACTFRCISGGQDSWTVGTDGSLRHISSKVGFFAAAAITKPTVTGSRGGNAALASLITALANLGLITDSTTA